MIRQLNYGTLKILVNMVMQTQADLKLVKMGGQFFCASQNFYMYFTSFMVNKSGLD